MAGAAGVAAVLAAVLAALTTLLVSCSATPAAEPSARASDIQIDAEVVQLRRDQVLQRVSVAVANRGATDVVVDSVRLRADGFRFPGTIRKDSPVADGVVVNLPVPYRVVDCPATGEPQVGRPQVTLRVHTEQDPEPRTLRIAADDGDGLLQRIASRACDVERTQQQVDLAFADGWRIEHTENGAEAHGTLRARLVDGPARDVTQVAGAILYGLRPDDGAADPLASLSAARPSADVPVVVFAARCDPHTIGEIKKPYEFLVWVTTPDGEEIAITPDVGQPTKDALQDVCAF
jgi:hypothetical protein